MFGDIEDFAVSEWSVEDLIVHWEERYLETIFSFILEYQYL